MDDQFPGRDSAKADFEVSPESSAGQDAAGFRASVQREKFLGGGSPETAYKEDYLLKEPERVTEGNEFTKGFVGLFEGDQEVQPAVKYASDWDTYYSNVAKFGERKLRIDKGTGKYILSKIGRGFGLTRIEGDINEHVKIELAASLNDRSLIEYTAFNSKSGYSLIKGHRGQIKEINNGRAIIKIREMLAKTQKDFGKV